MILRLTPWSAPEGLDGALAAAGLRRFDDTRVMLLPALAAAPETPPPLQLRLQALAAGPFAHAVGALRASPAAQCAAHGARLREAAAAWQGLVLVDAEGTAQACGAIGVEDGLAGLYDVHTAGTARRRGLAGWLCAELLRRARQAGASRAYLQVEGDNAAARSIYHRLGFADAYAYHYRTRDPRAA
jgi:ribosomal protein S18 acetylase RimI-like enzyme